jgi:[acyl-carrier-protein] S-malonyltransferase
MRNMLADGAKNIVECGPGNVLQGLFKKVDREVATSAA